jgi:hypothetical protein
VDQVGADVAILADSQDGEGATNETSSFLSQVSFERSSAPYEDRKLPQMIDDTGASNNKNKPTPLHDLIQRLRTNVEFKGIHYAGILGLFTEAILPEGEVVKKEDPVQTHWVPGTPVESVLPYRTEELRALGREDLSMLVMAIGSCRCPLNYVVHIFRALRLARRLSSKLLYMGVTHALQQKNPLVGYAMLKEATDVTAVKFPDPHYPGLQPPPSASSSSLSSISGYHEESDELGVYVLCSVPFYCYLSSFLFLLSCLSSHLSIYRSIYP